MVLKAADDALVGHCLAEGLPRTRVLRRRVDGRLTCDPLEARRCRTRCFSGLVTCTDKQKPFDMSAPLRQGKGLPLSQKPPRAGPSGAF